MRKFKVTLLETLEWGKDGPGRGGRGKEIDKRYKNVVL